MDVRGAVLLRNRPSTTDDARHVLAGLSGRWSADYNEAVHGQIAAVRIARCLGE